MGEKTGISWTDHTFNIAWGCFKVSAGCANCYALDLAKRYGHDVWGTAQRRVFGANHWKEPLKWDKAAEKAGVPAKCFSSSMCDIFEDHIAIEQERAKLWDLIRVTPNLQWQLVTKRANRIAANLPSDWGRGYPNVWLGVSIENENHVDRFNHHLRHIPAVVRFISYEPALGSLNGLKFEGLDWLIFGGESGPRFRQMDIQWARTAKHICEINETMFYYKQTAGRGPRMESTMDGKHIYNFPVPRKVPTPASFRVQPQLFTW